MRISEFALFGVVSISLCACLHGEEPTKQTALKYLCPGHYGTAISVLTVLIEKSPMDPELYYWRGAAKHKVGRLEGAIKDYTLSIDNGQKGHGPLLATAQIANDRGNFRRAASICRKITRLAPTNPNAWMGLGVAMDGLGERQSSIDAFRKAFQLSTDKSFAAKHLGFALAKNGSYKEAHQVYAEISAGDGEILFSRAQCSMALGKTEVTVKEFRQWLAKEEHQKGGYKALNVQTALDRAKLQHGFEQVRKMISDRPEMRQHLVGKSLEDDPLATWAARMFGGECGIEGYWDRIPMEGALAGHYVVENGGDPQVAYFRIAKQRQRGGPMTFSVSWACICFELFNVRDHREVNELYTRVRNHQVTKDEFTRLGLKLEYGAMRRTRAFYVDRAHKWISSRDIEIDDLFLYDWGLYLPYTFDEWFGAMRAGEHPKSYYSKMFDKLQGREN